MSEDFFVGHARTLHAQRASSRRSQLFTKHYLAFCLLATDILFVGIHCLWLLLPSVSNYSLSIEADRGYAEIFQYIKLFWIVLNFVSIAVLYKGRAYLAWALLFLYLLLDDSLLIHENVGSHLAEVLNFSSWLYLRPVDFGELLVSATAVGAFLGLFLLVYPSSSRQFRQDTRHLILLLCALAAFGIGVDMVHVMLDYVPGEIGRKLYYLAAIVEDGGEMFVVSLICYYSFSKLNAFAKLRASPMPVKD